MKRLPMRKIRDVLRLSAKVLSTRQVAASLAIGRTTLQGYLDRARDAGLSWPLPPEMSDAELEERLFAPSARAAQARNHYISRHAVRVNILGCASVCGKFRLAEHQIKCIQCFRTFSGNWKDSGG